MGALYIIGMVLVSVLFDIFQKRIIDFSGVVIAGIYAILYSVGYCVLKYIFGVDLFSWYMTLMCCVMYFFVAPIIVDVIVKSNYRKR
jgi:hypothetical protein